MDIYKPVSCEDIYVHNGIKTVGCNVLLLEGVGNIRWQTGDVPQRITKYLESFKKKLIGKVLAKDGDYGQVAIMNFGSTTFTASIEAGLREVFTVMFVSKIKGGHGNSNCTLVILDLSKLREEAGIDEPEDPEHGDEDDEEGEDEENV